MSAETIIEIINQKGLHARAAAKFVKTVAAYPAASVRVVKKAHGAEGDSAPVEGASILGLMMLGADPGSRLHIQAEGSQAAEVVQALQELIQNRFGEAE